MVPIRVLMTEMFVMFMMGIDYWLIVMAMIILMSLMLLVTSVTVMVMVSKKDLLSLSMMFMLASVSRTTLNLIFF